MKRDQIMQFKIQLKGIRPPIWRRIQVPGDYTFWDLHVAIQDAMAGWEDYHLHEFKIKVPGKAGKICIGIPDPDGYDFHEVLPGWEIPITRYFTDEKSKVLYIYDFGDGWEHTVILEKFLQPEPGVTYPRCIAGRRKCPPEDCGGPYGYESFLKAITDPKHPEHKEFLEWYGGEFDPNDFKPEDVHFFDPKEWFKIRIGDDYI